MTLLRDQGLGLDLAPPGLSPGCRDPAFRSLSQEKLLRAVNDGTWICHQFVEHLKQSYPSSGGVLSMDDAVTSFPHVNHMLMRVSVPLPRSRGSRIRMKRLSPGQCLGQASSKSGGTAPGVHKVMSLDGRNGKA